MRRHGDKVGQKKGRFAAAGQLHALHVGVMARRANHFNAWDDLLVAFEQPELAALLDRHEIAIEITGAVAFVRVQRVLVFAFLHEILRVRESWHRFVFLDARVSAAMVKVQVRVDDNIDVLRRYAVVAQARQ